MPPRDTSTRTNCPMTTPSDKPFEPSGWLLGKKIEAAMAACDRDLAARREAAEAAKEQEACDRMARIIEHEVVVGARRRRWGV